MHRSEPTPRDQFAKVPSASVIYLLLVILSGGSCRKGPMHLANTTKMKKTTSGRNWEEPFCSLIARLDFKGKVIRQVTCDPNCLPTDEVAVATPPVRRPPFSTHFLYQLCQNYRAQLPASIFPPCPRLQYL